MNDYAILTDSGADLGQDLVDELGVGVLPLSFFVRDKEYRSWPDWRDMPAKTFYAMLRSGVVPTTAPLEYEMLLETFRRILTNGRDILYIGLSSGISGAVASATRAARELAPEFPDATIRVVDTLSASLGEGLFVYNAVKMKEAGWNIEEVATWVEENQTKSIHLAVAESLDFLKKGGRLSDTADFSGSMLNIKPLVRMDDAGQPALVETIRGRKQSLEEMVKIMEKTMIDPKQGRVFIAHGDAIRGVHYLVREVRHRLGTKKFYVNDLGPTCGSHLGPDSIAVFYLGSKR